jgi:MFS family permease
MKDIGRRFEDAGPIEGIVLILPSFLAIMGGLTLVPILPQMQQEFAGTPNLPFLIQAVLTVPSLIVVGFAPIAGILGDRFGRKRLLLFSMLAYSLAGLSPLLINSIYVLLASRVVLGFAEATVLVLATTLLGDAFSGHARDRWFGYQIGGGALFAIPLLAAAGFMGEQGWRAAFLIYALPLVMFLLVLFIAKERQGRTHESEAHDQATAEKSRFPWGHMRLVGAISLFASVSFFILQLQQGLALAEIGVKSPEDLGRLTAIASIGAPCGALLFRYIAHWPPSLLLTVSFGAAGAGLLGVATAETPAAMVAVIFTGLVGTNILLPTMLSWTARGLPLAMRARGIGIWQGIFAVGQFISAMLFGWFIAIFGSAHYAFLLVGLSVVAAGIASALIYAGARRNRLSAA